jgi:hypothetical protein
MCFHRENLEDEWWLKPDLLMFFIFEQAQFFIFSFLSHVNGNIYIIYGGGRNGLYVIYPKIKVVYLFNERTHKLAI